MSKFADGGMDLRADFRRMYVFVLLPLVLMMVLGIATFGYAWADATIDPVELIRDTVVFANVTEDTPAYDNYASGRKKIGEFSDGEIVEVVRDRAFEWYLVKAENGKEGWVSVDSLSIPSDPETNTEQLPTATLEAFVNMRALTSKTDHLVWVDIDRQLTHVFTGKQGDWTLKHTMPCSTGKNVSPTLRGLHEIAERGEWFFTERLARGGSESHFLPYVKTEMFRCFFRPLRSGKGPSPHPCAPVPAAPAYRTGSAALSSRRCHAAGNRKSGRKGFHPA